MALPKVFSDTASIFLIVVDLTPCLKGGIRHYLHLNEAHDAKLCIIPLLAEEGGELRRILQELAEAMISSGLEEGHSSQAVAMVLIFFISTESFNVRVR